MDEDLAERGAGEVHVDSASGVVSGSGGQVAAEVDDFGGVDAADSDMVVVVQVLVGSADLVQVQRGDIGVVC